MLQKLLPAIHIFENNSWQSFDDLSGIGSSPFFEGLYNSSRGSVMHFQQIQSSEEESIISLSAFASAIIREYYDPIIGVEQNNYHLEKFQSVHAIKEQLEQGYIYYVLFEDENMLGFFAFYPREDALYLSKFYLAKKYRGKGYGKAMLLFLKQEVRKLGLAAIELNVNRFNPTTAIYDHLGFHIIRAEQVQIGHGFIMDDYVYRLEIS